MTPTVVFQDRIDAPAAFFERYRRAAVRRRCRSPSRPPCPREVKRAMIDWWGPVSHEAYGSSELGYMTLFDSQQAQRQPGSAGLALPGVSLRILDEPGVEQPRGTPGLIYVGQPGTVDFTYNTKDASRKAMERDGHLTMGDIGYLDDEGFLFIVDRAADMVISGDVNIYPAEIEACLHRFRSGSATCNSIARTAKPANSLVVRNQVLAGTERWNASM